MPFFREDPLFRRPRGRRRAIKRLEIKRVAPKEIRPRPRLIEESPPDPIYKKRRLPVLEAGDDLERFLDMGSQEWLYDILTPIEINPALFASPSPVSQTSNAPLTATMSRPNRRPYERRIDHAREAIERCSLLMNGDHRDPWVSFERSLHSNILEYSYIYETTIALLGHSYHPYPVWKVTTHLGILEAKGFANIYMAKDPYGAYNPKIITFYVLPGSPPLGGVDFIMGSRDLNEVYGGNWTPEQHAGQDVQQ